MDGMGVSGLIQLNLGLSAFLNIFKTKSMAVTGALSGFQQGSFRKSAQSPRHNLGFEVVILCIVYPGFNLVELHHPAKLSYYQEKEAHLNLKQAMKIIEVIYFKFWITTKVLNGRKISQTLLIIKVRVFTDASSNFHLWFSDLHWDETIWHMNRTSVIVLFTI